MSTSAPTSNGLYTTVCSTTGGLMPLGCPPSSVLLPDDMARIAAWIKAGGAKN